MGRAVAIELSEEEQRELRALLLRRRSLSSRRCARGSCCAAHGANEHADRGGGRVSLLTVGSSRGSFCERRLDGVTDAPRSGRPHTIDDDGIQRVLAMTPEAPPDGSTQWSVRRLATATGISPTTVHRMWREHKLKPHQVRSFKFSKAGC